MNTFNQNFQTLMARIVKKFFILLFENFNFRLTVAGISSCVAETSSFLNWLEASIDLEAPVKIYIRNLRFKTSVLNSFFACKGKFQIDDKYLKALLNHIQLLGQNALQDIQLLWFDMNFISSKEDWTVPENLDTLISSALEKLDLINPLIQQVYVALSSLTRSMSSKTNAVVEYIEALVENMNDLLSCKAQPIVHVEKEIKALIQDLLFLRNFLLATENWCGAEHENFKNILVHAESMADNTACLLYLCSEHSSKMDEDMINHIKLQFSCQLQRIKPIEPNVRQSYIAVLKSSKSSEVSDFIVDEHILGFIDSLLGNMIELLNLKASPMISVIHGIETLHDELRILRYYFMDSSEQLNSEWPPNLNDFLLHIKIVACKTACLIYSCYDRGFTEDLAGQLNLTIGDVLQKVKVIKEKARVIYDKKIPKSLRFNFPKTNERGFVDSMIQNLKELLHSKAGSTVQLQYQIEEIHVKIVSLRGDFIEIEAQPSEHVELKDLWERFKDMVYHSEYVMDLAIIGDEPLWWYKLGLFVAIEEINNIREVVGNVKDRCMNNTISGTSSQPNSNLQVVDIAEMPINHVELFEDEAKMITEQLTNGLSNLHVLSIVGMPGIGKTTLANSLYENPAVRLNFHVRARCCVTQTYEKRRLFLEILKQVNLEADPGDEMNDDDLATKIYRSLKGRKYLIFFDDLWDICSWYDMRTSFPDDNKGSRIMFTSRFHDIASQIDSRSITFPLHQLSDAKSWELLQNKLFKKESCPPKLLKVGKELATKCKGLPLAINLIAGLLKNMERREEGWKQFTCTLNTRLLEGEQGCMGVLELSYNNLPSHLKPCFLYLGAFPEDTEVPARKLTWLWIAEGFIQMKNDEKESLEYVAEKYLNDLIARSLVIVSQRRSIGGVKVCRIHDLLREFCLSKAKEEFFFQTPISDLHELKDPYRFCVETAREISELPRNYTPRIRSLLCFNTVRLNFWDDSAVIRLKELKLLRVLHLPPDRKDYFLTIFRMKHLRFLHLEYKYGIPSNVGYLQNLEIFVATTFSNEEVPETIWKLKKLRHFKVGMCYLTAYSIKDSLNFDNLQTLSTPVLIHGEYCEKVMRGLRNLRSLSCKFLGSWDDTSNCNRLPVLDFLTLLESLKVAYIGPMLHSFEFKFPPNLKKLTLSKFGLPWSEISAIGKLPNLQVLKLLDDAFVGESWDMEEGGFCKLKFLKLKSLNVKQWNTSEEHLPCLETLLFSKCSELKEIPYCLGDVPTLQRLELKGCRASARISAAIVKEKQEEMGNEQFVITYQWPYSARDVRNKH